MAAKRLLTDEQYEALLAAQDGRCAICRSRPVKYRLAEDHNHRTGVMRGLLCNWCNHKLLGGARESVMVLRAAIAYLEDPPAVRVLGEIGGRRFRPQSFSPAGEKGLRTAGTTGSVTTGGRNDRPEARLEEPPRCQPT